MRREFISELKIFNSALKGYRLFILSLCVMQIVGIIFAYQAWQEWQLGRELAEVGISTTAIVQSCDLVDPSDDDCTLIYEYQTSQVGQEQGYIGVENYICDKCSSRLPGSQVTIKYLPHAPDQARLEDSIVLRILTSYSFLGSCAIWLTILIKAGLWVFWKSYIHVWLKILSRIVVGLIKKWIIEPLARWLDYLARKLGG